MQTDDHRYTRPFYSWVGALMGLVLVVDPSEGPSYSHQPLPQLAEWASPSCGVGWAEAHGRALLGGQLQRLVMR